MVTMRYCGAGGGGSDADTGCMPRLTSVCNRDYSKAKQSKAKQYRHRTQHQKGSADTPACAGMSVQVDEDVQHVMFSACETACV
jgi:hypothetical protein